MTDYRPRYFRLDPRTHEVEPIICENHRDEVLVWARDFEDRGREPVASTSIPGGGRVSTVFLGLDHSHGLSERRQLFETMTFPARECWRWATYDEALEGHAALVAELTKGKK
jgi:hypothetical protein